MYKIFLRRYSQILALTGCTASLGFMFIGRKYIDRYRIYNTMTFENGKALFCDDYTHQLLMEVGKKMGIMDDDLKRIILYHTSFDSPVSKGCLNSPIQSWLPEALIPNPGIGLPSNYKHVYLDDNSFEKLMINGKPLEIDSDSAEGVEFRRQMLLSEDAKKFILARQLFYLQSNIDLISDCLTVATVYVTYQILFIINRTIPAVLKLRLPYRASLYTGITGLIYIAQRELFEAYMLRLHYKADKKALLGQRYHSGALEYYEKLIKRNKCLHKFGFTKEFNKLGNEVSGIIFNYNVTNSHVRLSRLMNPKEVS